MSDTERVTADDLAFAADWLDAYDDEHDGGDGSGTAAARRVRDWLRAEVARRAEDAAVRDLVKTTGATPARARAALRDAMDRGTR
jgi:hypothetical protein